MGRRQSEASCSIHCTSLKMTEFWKPFPLLCHAKKTEEKLQKLFILQGTCIQTRLSLPLEEAFGRSLWLLQKKTSALQMKPSNSPSNLPSCSKAVPQLHIWKNILSVDMKMHTVTELVGVFITSGNRVIHMSTQTNLHSSQFPSTFYLTWS